MLIVARAHNKHIRLLTFFHADSYCPVPEKQDCQLLWPVQGKRPNSWSSTRRPCVCPSLRTSLASQSLCHTHVCCLSLPRTTESLTLETRAKSIPMPKSGAAKPKAKVKAKCKPAPKPEEAEPKKTAAKRRAKPGA